MTTAPVVMDKQGETVDPNVVNRFLSSLRDSGKINMFGASPYVAEMFDVSQSNARKLVAFWMETALREA